MQVWTVVNQKGGVGKTTSSVSLAGCLSALGYKVLLLDLDPQASLTHYLGFDSDNLEYNIYDLFMASQHAASLSKVYPKTLLHTNIKNIALLPSHMALATLDKSLAQQTGKGLIVKTLLEKFGQKFDYAIIDCQPVLGVLMVNALLAASKVIIPTQTEHLAKLGLGKMLATIEQMKPSMQSNFTAHVVPTMFDRRLKACVNAFEDLRAMFKDVQVNETTGPVPSKLANACLWRGYIPLDTKFREASVLAKPINFVSCNARGSFAYEKLTTELLKSAKL